MLTKCKNNVEFFWKNLERYQRIDGRALFDSRNISIYFLREYGNSVITMGNTKVVCTITGEIVEPLEKRPNEGIVRIHLDTDSFTHITDNSKTNEECIEIRNMIDKTLKASKTLNFESLCIVPYKKVWCIYINLTVLEHDGNIFDACFLATYSSLVHFQKTEVKVDENFGNNKILNINETESLSLSVHNIPILSTFAYFEKNDTFLMDPTLYEQELMSSHFSVAVNKDGKLINVLKPGGSPIDYMKMIELIEIAKQRVPAVLKILQDAIDEDRNARNAVMKCNLHVQYSCKPVPVIYSEEIEEITEFKKSIPTEQITVIEKLFEAYENAEEGGGEEKGGEEKGGEGKGGEEKGGEEKGGEGKDKLYEKTNQEHSVSNIETNTNGVYFEQKLHRNERGIAHQKKTEDDEQSDYTSSSMMNTDDKNKVSQSMIEAMLENAKKALRKKDGITDTDDIIRRMEGENDSESNKRSHMHTVFENFPNLFYMKNEKEQRDMLRIKRQEMVDAGELPTNKFLKTEKIDRLGKWDSGSQVGIKRTLDNLLEQHGDIEREYVNMNKKVVNSSNSYKENTDDIKKKKNENLMRIPSIKEEESSSDVDFSVAINENLTPIKKKEKKKKVKKEKKH